MDASITISKSRFVMTKKLAYMLFVGLFGAELAVAALVGHTIQLTAVQWAIFAFAVFRASRCIAFDSVMQPLRDPFVKVVPHDSGAGDTTVARTDVGPLREVIGELITCPICNGTHVTSVLILGLAFLPAPTQIFIAIMAIVGLREFLEPAFEAMQWAGEYLRHENGRRHHNR